MTYTPDWTVDVGDEEAEDLDGTGSSSDTSTDDDE
jgi:hypothetical protein